MTTWTVVDEGDRDFTVSISQEGRDRLAAEQRLTKLDPLYARVNVISLVCGVLAIAGLVIKQIWSVA